MKLNIRKKLTFIICLSTGTLFSLIVAFLTFKANNLLQKEAFASTEQMASKYGNDIQSYIENAFDSPRALAEIFEGYKSIDEAQRRPYFNLALTHVLAANEHLLAAWTLWEPDALDGKDKEFVSKEGTDASGRFIPYWNRGSGKIILEPLVDYEKEGPGDYYLIPKRTGIESIINPYIYPVAGKDVLMTSLVVPIKDNGKFVGVVGADMALDSLQTLVSKIRPYDVGFAILVANKWCRFS